jgi:hypothetical protein
MQRNFHIRPNARQELTAYLNLSEESPIFLKFMEGLNQVLPPTNDFLVSITAVYKELSYNLLQVNTRRNSSRVDLISCMAIDSRFTPL